MQHISGKAEFLTLAIVAGCMMAALHASAATDSDRTYLVDPAKGDDTNPAGKAWKTFGKLNSIKLAAGDKVVIAPGLQEETLRPMGEGTPEKPVVIQFLPGIHTIGIRNVTRVPMFVSNSMDSDEPKPVGIMIDGFKHLRLQEAVSVVSGKARFSTTARWWKSSTTTRRMSCSQDWYSISSAPRFPNSECMKPDLRMPSFKLPKVRIMWLRTGSSSGGATGARALSARH